MSWIRGTFLWVRPGREEKGVILVVRRKLGNAVMRNRLKRRLRVLCRSNENCIPMSLVVLCQPPATQAPFSELEQEFEALLSKLGRT